MCKAVEIIRTAITKFLQNKAISSNKQIDEGLLQLSGENPQLNIGKNILSIISLGISKAIAYSRGLPLYQYFSCAQRNSPAFAGINHIPKMMLTCLRGGKAFASKVKVFLSLGNFCSSQNLCLCMRQK